MLLIVASLANWRRGLNKAQTISANHFKVLRGDFIRKAKIKNTFENHFFNKKMGKAAALEDHAPLNK